MRKNVWILNHYAGGTFFNKGGRHYNISKFLKQAGYEPVVFVSNSKNKKEAQQVVTDRLWIEQTTEETQVPYVFVKSRKYSSNGLNRILNMIDFYRYVQKAAVQYAAEHGKPDVIYASSVHPLTLVAGEKLAKRFGVKCICEVRDLWPESLVAYGHLKKNSLLAKILYAFERRIYLKADKVIMTWPGGYDYIREKGWDREIPEDKIVHICNGVDLEKYRENVAEKPYSDEELLREDVKKIIYAGSIREVNNLGIVVEAAEVLQKRSVSGFKFLIYGDGNEREKLIRRVKDKGLNNIVFTGKVPKENVPSVLSRAYVTLLHNTSTSLDKYGQSQNKFFEYLAAGRPVLMTYSVGHSVCKARGCGFEIEKQSPEAIADAVEMVLNLDEKTYAECSRNAEKTAEEYDFARLTGKLISVIEE